MDFELELLSWLNNRSSGKWQKSRKMGFSDMSYKKNLVFLAEVSTDCLHPNYDIGIRLFKWQNKYYLYIEGKYLRKEDWYTERSSFHFDIEKQNSDAELFNKVLSLVIKVLGCWFGNRW